MYLVSVLPRSDAVLKFAEDRVGHRNPTEIVYVAEEFINGEFSTTNVCYRIVNPKAGRRGEISELTFLDKYPVRI